MDVYTCGSHEGHIVMLLCNIRRVVSMLIHVLSGLRQIMVQSGKSQGVVSQILSLLFILPVEDTKELPSHI